MLLRIKLRCSVLNVKGVYNRSKLTRLVVDHDKPPANRRKGDSLKELNSEVVRIQPWGDKKIFWGGGEVGGSNQHI